MTSRTKEQNREYMRVYMQRRRRRIKRGVRDVGVAERRPIVLPPARYADIASMVLEIRRSAGVRSTRSG